MAVNRKSSDAWSGTSFLVSLMLLLCHVRRVDSAATKCHKCVTCVGVDGPLTGLSAALGKTNSITSKTASVATKTALGTLFGTDCPETTATAEEAITQAGTSCVTMFFTLYQSAFSKDYANDVSCTILGPVEKFFAAKAADQSAEDYTQMMKDWTSSIAGDISKAAEDASVGAVGGVYVATCDSADNCNSAVPANDEFQVDIQLDSAGADLQIGTPASKADAVTAADQYVQKMQTDWVPASAAKFSYVSAEDNTAGTNLIVKMTVEMPPQSGFTDAQLATAVDGLAFATAPTGDLLKIHDAIVENGAFSVTGSTLNTLSSATTAAPTASKSVTASGSVQQSSTAAAAGASTSKSSESGSSVTSASLATIIVSAVALGHQISI